MPAHPRQPPSAAPQAPPASPSTKGTAKYTNKDGSKFITVPKAPVAAESSQSSPAATPPSAARKGASQPDPTGPSDAPALTVNRKKQKRRAKAAAKAAAEKAQTSQPVNGLSNPATSASHDLLPAEAEPEDSDEEGDQGSGSSADRPLQGDGHTGPAAAKSKKNKRKKKKSTATDAEDAHIGHGSHHTLSPPPPPPPAPSGPGISREKIWNTSSQEERERIKEFWLGLGEDERKSLVKVEKDAVLKKMKEQQKHTCSCSVCGRKRTAIEEELEGLYDAYYQELEQFANHPTHQGEGPSVISSPRGYGPMGAVRAPRGPPANYSRQPSRGRIVEQLGDDEEEEEEEEDGEEDEDEADDDYSDDDLDEDDEYSDEEPVEIHRPGYAADFFNFGNSLTVQGGILTVADDLLKNDGKKFIEMMEQLAERRMAREEDAREQYARSYGHTNGSGYGQAQPPPPEEEEYEDEEEEEEEYEEEDDYDSQEEEDSMTEEQRMEEGRRMFQIFAARMFEQRVLTAYKEKVAKERQQKLLEELEEENRQVTQRKAKKAKEAQKRKDKAAKKKEALAEEKARKEAEKAAEAEARLAEEARKAEEQRQKAEEKRKKKEAQKKAEEEDRLRKEAERQRRIHEQKEKQAEQERKAREAREKEKKMRDDAKQKEKEAREKEVREKANREKEAKEKKDREARSRKDRDTRERKEVQDCDRRSAQARESKEGGGSSGSGRSRPEREARRDDRHGHKGAGPGAAPSAAPAAAPATAAAPITLPKRPAPHAVPALPQQPTPAPPPGFASPQIPVATPALPKAPTPVRPRQVSQQQEAGTSNASQATSFSGSAASQNPSPHAVTPTHASPGPIGSSSKPGSASTQGAAQQPSQAASPLGMASKALPPQSGPIGVPSMPIFGPPGIPQAPSAFVPSRSQHEAHFNPFNPGFRSPGMMSIPPGVGGPPGGRGYSMPHPHIHHPHPHHVPQPPPGFGQTAESQFAGSVGQGFAGGPPKDGSSHSRQPSGGHEAGPTSAAAAAAAPSSQPFARPTPIGRPASVVHGQRRTSGSPATGRATLDAGEHHLGSSALLDDSDVPLQELAGSAPRHANTAPGPRLAFPQVPFGMDAMFPAGHNPWGPTPTGAQGTLFSPPPPPGFGPNPVASAWAPPAPSSSAFGSQGVLGRPSQPRSVAVRQMLCRACKELADAENVSADGQQGAGNSDGSTASGTASGSSSRRRGYIPLETIRMHLGLQISGEPVAESELLAICETEGNSSNGGGSFETLRGDFGRPTAIRWVPGGGGAGGQQPFLQRPVGAGPSEIGSPPPAVGAVGTVGAGSNSTLSHGSR